MTKKSYWFAMKKTKSANSVVEGHF